MFFYWEVPIELMLGVTMCIKKCNTDLGLLWKEKKTINQYLCTIRFGYPKSEALSSKKKWKPRQNIGTVTAL